MWTIDNYANFSFPYNGKNNDDYAKGECFCCDDVTPEVARVRNARLKAATGNFKPNVAYESSQFYYHPDHLGSSSYITNLDGDVVQHIEYVPFGEVFIEERNNVWNTPYLFNAKELDEETGMYYYGARYYDPRISLWISTDPLQEKYPNISTYCYTRNNPVNAIDPDGRKILFVNGHYQNNFIGRLIGSDKSGKAYWGRGFENRAMEFFNDYSNINNTNYINGSSMIGIDMSGKDRYNAGYEYARKNIKSLINGLQKGETFKMVTHSEGSAYGAGVAQYLIDQGYIVETIVHLSADEGDEFTTPIEPLTIQLSYYGDWVTGNKAIKNTNLCGEVNSTLSWKYVHGSTKDAIVFNQLEDLLSVRIQDNIGMLRGRFASWKSQVSGTAKHGTDFKKIDGFIIRNEDGSAK